MLTTAKSRHTVKLQDNTYHFSLNNQTTCISHIKYMHHHYHSCKSACNIKLKRLMLWKINWPSLCLHKKFTPLKIVSFVGITLAAWLAIPGAMQFSKYFMKQSTMADVRSGLLWTTKHFIFCCHNAQNPFVNIFISCQ